MPAWSTAFLPGRPRWAQYLDELFSSLPGFRMPEIILAAPGEGGIFNLPAIVLVTLCGLLLMRGARESATVNAVMVIIKIAVLIFFVIIASRLSGVRTSRRSRPSGSLASVWPRPRSSSPLSASMPSRRRARRFTTPGERFPLAIIFATIIVTTVYILVAVAGIGAQPYQGFEGQEAGLAVILRNITGSAWPAAVLSAGAVISIFSVTLVTLYGQTRILFAMGRDGMLPEVFHRINPTSLVPVRNTIIVCIFVGALAGFVPLGVLIDLTSMGTLVAFTVVSIGVIILRRTQPACPGDSGPWLSGHAHPQRCLRPLHHLPAALPRSRCSRCGSGSRP